MTRLRARLRDESGQVLVFVAVILVGIVGMAALVVDVGSWYHAQRKLQTAADAAALAGAQHLPTELSTARSVALDFAQKNYAGIPAPAVTFPDAGTIDVAARAETPGIFAPVLNAAFDVITVHANAQARVFAPSQLKDVAPIAVHTSMACIVTDPGCYGQSKTLTLVEDSEYDPTKSKFGLLDLDRGGSVGAGEMKDWLENGYSDYLPVDTYYPPANGEKNGIKKQLEDAADEQRMLLFPVYDTATSSRGYHVVGWAAFVIDDVVRWAGSTHELKGHFVTFLATDLAAGNPITDPSQDFGVHVITLTK
jgi:Flp pilus assembly protein TadG